MIKLLERAKEASLVPLSFESLCRLSLPIAGLKESVSLPTLAFKSPRTSFTSCIVIDILLLLILLQMFFCVFIDVYTVFYMEI